MNRYKNIPQIMIDMVEKSDVRLNPKFNIDIDMILQVGDILLGKPRDGVLTESEEKWFFIFNTLILYCFNYEMKNNPVTLQSVFEIFNSGKQYEMTKDEGNINLVEKMVKNNLIESEEYEKVIELNNKKNK
jgi:hypothetical protein